MPSAARAAATSPGPSWPVYSCAPAPAPPRSFFQPTSLSGSSPASHPTPPSGGQEPRASWLEPSKRSASPGPARLTAADAANAVQFRRDNPENPLPLLLVLLDTLPADSLGRWSALLTDAARLGIAIVFLADSPAAISRFTVNDGRTVVDAEPVHLAERLTGAELYGLCADEVVELLGSVTAANHQVDDNHAMSATTEPIAPLHPDGVVIEPSRQSIPSDEPWPEIALSEDTAQADRPLHINLLGPYRITAFSEPVTTGLRNRAKALLAWCLLRPEGATADQAVDALWPDTPPDRVLKQFWYALGDLRSFFHGPADESLDVLEKVGEHYRPNPAEITCDLWDFQSALAAAARADHDDQARAASAPCRRYLHRRPDDRQRLCVDRARSPRPPPPDARRPPPPGRTRRASRPH